MTHPSTQVRCRARAVARWALASFLAGTLSAAVPVASAQVHKCIAADGGTTFSNMPCPPAARTQPVAVKPNVVDTSESRALSERVVPAPESRAEPRADDRPGRPANVCPSDGEIRNMEVRAGSTTMNEDERRFLQDEIRRARQCRKGQGQYDAQDWALSREAQDAQSQSSARSREAARRRAEGMHSAADPAEGDRIDARRREEALRLRPLPPTQPVAAFASCTVQVSGRCVTPAGETCTAVAGGWRCPNGGVVQR